MGRVFNSVDHRDYSSRQYPNAKQSKKPHENELLFAEESTAYSLKNGKCDDLISKEDNIILAEVLDNVSNDIASDFDKLLSLKYES